MTEFRFCGMIDFMAKLDKTNPKSEKGDPMEKEYLDNMDPIQKDNLDNLVDRERGLFLLKLSKKVENRIKTVQDELFESYNLDGVWSIRNLDRLIRLRDKIDLELSDIE